MTDVTEIIERIENGDSKASANLLPPVYEELRKLAAVRMRSERLEHTLTPTALVHEAFVRLVRHDQSQQWHGRGHFFSAAAEAMRRILIEHARKKDAAKRGGGVQKISLIDTWLAEQSNRKELLEVDDALRELEKTDAQAATLVKLRFFVGMTNRQAADNLNISARKADMLWAYARAWLKRELSNSDGEE
ncbi:MAG: ECF-type sigma factor [Planctomycetota bacterium]